MKIRLTALALAPGLIASVIAAVALQPAEATPGEKHKVTICHATGADGKWVKQNVDIASIAKQNGHAYHQGGRDIIPPFEAAGKVEAFPGLNWDADGKAIWKNGCEVPAEPEPTPTPSETPEPTQEPEVTETPEPSETPDPTPTPTVTSEPTPDPTPTVTVTASPDPQPTETVTVPAPTETATEPVPDPAPTVTVTASPEPQPAVTVTSSPSFTPTASSTSTTDPWADFDSDEILADVVREVHAVYPWHEGNPQPTDEAPVASATSQVPGLPSTGANR